jgi:hypothetical protein
MRRKKTVRTIELTFERSEISVALKPRSTALSWCPSCRAHVPFVTPAEAARQTGASLRTIFRWVEASEIHFLETPDRVLLVCLASLG